MRPMTADSDTGTAWTRRLVGCHRRAIRQAAGMAVVLLCAGTAEAAQDQPPAPAQTAKPAMMGMKMAEMKQACAAKHEAAASEVQALAKTVTEAKSSNDIVVLRAALDATLRHIEGMQAKAAKCAGMMTAEAPAVASPKDEGTHKH